MLSLWGILRERNEFNPFFDVHYNKIYVNSMVKMYFLTPCNCFLIIMQIKNRKSLFTLRIGAFPPASSITWQPLPAAVIFLEDVTNGDLHQSMEKK